MSQVKIGPEIKMESLKGGSLSVVMGEEVLFPGLTREN